MAPIKTAALARIVLIAILVIASSAPSKIPALTAFCEDKMDDKVNVDLDESTAVQVAEAVLVRVYGKEVLDEKPWNVTSIKRGFRIEGTLRASKGGVAEIEIDRTNCEVILIAHGK
jgi:hypothetical protein